MIINEKNHGMEIDGAYYYVGMEIIGKDCEYAGLIGKITEIRDGDDKETENDSVDIYCTFEAPSDEMKIKELEKLFSDLFQVPKLLEDINLDFVIMDNEMIEEKDEPNVITMRYVGYDSFDRPVYKDKVGKLFKDVAPRARCSPDLCTTDSFGGEPDTSISSISLYKNKTIKFLPYRVTW